VCVYVCVSVSCEPCDTSCSACTGPSVGDCIDCADSFYWEIGACVQNCSDGYYGLALQDQRLCQMYAAAQRYVAFSEIFNDKLVASVRPTVRPFGFDFISVSFAVYLDNRVTSKNRLGLFSKKMEGQITIGLQLVAVPSLPVPPPGELLCKTSDCMPYEYDSPRVGALLLACFSGRCVCVCEFHINWRHF